MTAFDSGNDIRRLALAGLMLLAMSATTSYVQAEDASEKAVTISIDFPGGNARVTANSDTVVHLEPDLRGGRPWFYWYFEATSRKRGKVTFVFPEKVAGFKNGAIGFQGPAVSTDQGETWTWMGTNHVDGSSFYYDFANANQRVRFAVTIPYVQKELDAFLELNSSNRHLKKSVLTKSQNGRDVDLLQIGSPGSKVKAMLVTGRHHAAETIASYVLEGFLQEAMSDSPSGNAFREKYVLYAVPLVDRDGVEEGDQGKNRRPHDHNRDYGKTSIYPEIQAIKKLDETANFRFALDFHCPTLVMNDHQVMYFVGAKEHPQYNFQNVTELASWIKKGLPKNAPVGPYVWLRSTQTPAPMNSHYFGFKQGTIMAATFEIPFAPPGKATDPSSCRKYGRTVLSAWATAHFKEPDGKPTGKGENAAALEKRTNFVARAPDKFAWLPPEATGDAGRDDDRGEPDSSGDHDHQDSQADGRRISVRARICDRTGEVQYLQHGNESAGDIQRYQRGAPARQNPEGESYCVSKRHVSDQRSRSDCDRSQRHDHRSERFDAANQRQR